MKSAEKKRTNIQKVGEVIVLPPLPDEGKKKIPLSRLSEVRREMAHIYRMARAGNIETQDLSRLTFALGQIGKIIELETFEARIDRLEKGITHGIS